MNTHSIRNRIKGHRRVRAGDLVPHEWNFRVHPEMQRGALLAYELPDGRLNWSYYHREVWLVRVQDVGRRYGGKDRRDKPGGSLPRLC